MPLVGGYPTNIRPVSNITPFTYRDGLSYLKVIEELINYVNSKLVDEINVSIADLVTQMNTTIDTLNDLIVENEDHYNVLLTEYVTHMQELVNTINGKTGSTGIVRLDMINSENAIEIDDTWADNQPLIMQVTNRDLLPVEFTSPNIIPEIEPTSGGTGWLNSSSVNYSTGIDYHNGRRTGSPSFKSFSKNAVNTYYSISRIGGSFIPVAPNTVYTASFWVRQTLTAGSTIQITQWDASKVNLNINIDKSSLVSANSWYRHVSTFTTGPNTHYINIVTWSTIDKAPVGSGAYLCDAQLEYGSIATPFVGKWDNPDNINPSIAQYTQFDVTPQPDGTWKIEDWHNAIDRMREELDTAIDEINNHVDEVSTNLGNQLAKVKKTATANGHFVWLGDYVPDTSGNVVCSDKFQEALDAAIDGILYIPQGRYLIDRKMVVRKNSKVIGIGSPTISRTENYHSTMITNLDLDDTTTTEYSGAGNITLEGFNIDGGPEHPASGGLVLFIHSHDIVIDNVNFLRCTGYHHLEFNATRDSIVQNSRFLGHIYRSGAGYHREAIQIDYIRETVASHGAGDKTTCQRITIRDCQFAGDTYGNPGPHICVGTHTNPPDLFRDITVENCVGTNLAQSGVSFANVANLSISNNRFKLNGTLNTTDFPSCIELANDCDNATVINNTCEVPDGYIADGIRCGDVANRALIIGNMITYGRNGVGVVGGVQHLITGNNIKFTSNNGIRLEDTDRSMVSGNYIIGAGHGNPSIASFITVVGKTDHQNINSSIVGNVCLPSTDSSDQTVPIGVLCYGGYVSNVWISGNRFRGCTDVATGDGFTETGNTLS